MNEKEKKYGIIYKATHIKSGKVYIGQTVRTLEERRREHERDAKNGSTTHFHNAIRKYGENAFKWEIIDTATTKDELDEKEKYWIAHHDAVNQGYNIADGGGGLGSEAVRRLWQNEEYRKKISESLKGKRAGEKHHFYGKTHKEETKRKIRDALKGKFSGENNPMYGKTLSKETRRKISEAHKGLSAGEKHPRAKINTIQAVFVKLLTPAIKTNKNRCAVFSQADVAEWFDVSTTRISAILSGKTWTHLPTFEQIRDIWRELMNNDNGAA